MNIKDFMAGKKITEEDIAQLKRNREGNPFLGSMDQMTADNGKIMQFVLGGKMPASESAPEAPDADASDAAGKQKPLRRRYMENNGQQTNTGE